MLDIKGIIKNHVRDLITEEYVTDCIKERVDEIFSASQESGEDEDNSTPGSLLREDYYVYRKRKLVSIPLLQDIAKKNNNMIQIDRLKSGSARIKIQFYDYETLDSDKLLIEVNKDGEIMSINLVEQSENRILLSKNETTESLRETCRYSGILPIYFKEINQIINRDGYKMDIGEFDERRYKAAMNKIDMKGKKKAC